MSHHPAHQGVVSSPIDNLSRRCPRIFYSDQLFSKAFALNKKSYVKWSISLGIISVDNDLLVTSWWRQFQDVGHQRLITYPECYGKEYNTEWFTQQSCKKSFTNITNLSPTTVTNIYLAIKYDSYTLGSYCFDMVNRQIRRLNFSIL